MLRSFCRLGSLIVPNSESDCCLNLYMRICTMTFANFLLQYPIFSIHRLGRTARAGKDGKGGLLLANYEEAHMVKKELADMPLEPTPVKVSSRAAAIVEQAKQNVGRDQTLRVSAEQAYRAWLGYYNGHVKKIRWDKKLLVQQANLWARQNGLTEQPSLQKKTVGKMGLRGVPGLKLE